MFGHWDSRDSATKKSTKSKARRIIRSEIVACNVQRVTKRSQYWSSIDPEVSEELGQVLSEAKEAAQQNPDSKNPASQLGMTDVPAPESPGGVIAFGPIERTAIIALSGVRTLATFAPPSETGGITVDAGKTLALRRYLFALALASVADPGVWDLREGCVLVRESKTVEWKVVADPSAFTAVLVKHSGEENPCLSRLLGAAPSRASTSRNNIASPGTLPRPRDFICGWRSSNPSPDRSQWVAVATSG